jgi:antitoxin Phd
MAKMTVSEARERLSEVVEVSRTEAVVLERYGKPAAILVSPDRYEEMMDALEEIRDAVAFDEAMSDEGDDIPWEQVRTDLGWS